MPCSRRRLAGMAKTSFSPLKILATAVLSALALAGCSNSTGGGSDQESENPASPEPQTGGTLIYASGDAEPDCLDPHYGGNYPQGLISTQYLETLLTEDEDDEIIPWLAESSEVSVAGLTHLITQTDRTIFHDRTKLTAEAITSNIEQLPDPDTPSSTGYPALENFETVALLDDLVAELHLSAPDNALEESLSMHWTA